MEKSPCKMSKSFQKCQLLHLQLCLAYDAGEKLRFYISNCLKKHNKLCIDQFVQCMVQLNNYIKEQTFKILGEPLPVALEDNSIDWKTQKEFEFEYKIDSLTTLSLRPTFAKSNSVYRNLSEQFSTNDLGLVNESTSSVRNDNSSTNFENEIKAQVNAGIDQIFSTWSKSDEVISNIASLNRPTTPILISGLLPEQYFLNFSAGKKNQYLVVQKRFDLAVEQIIAAELADKNILEILDGKKGIYGHRYNLKDGGVTVKVVSGPAFSSRIQAISANLKAGRIKNLLGS